MASKQPLQKKTMFVCYECGGTGISIQVWIDYNTQEIKAETNSEGVWCSNCLTEVDVKEVPTHVIDTTINYQENSDG